MDQFQNQSQVQIDDLPPEIFACVIKLLPPQDLKAAALVSRRWMELVEDPRFWTWAVVSIDTNEDRQKLNKRRFQLLKDIKVTRGCVDHGWGMGWDGMTKLFKAVDEIPTVSMIHGLSMCKGISAVEPNLVVRVLNRLKVLILGNNRIDLTPEQLELLFNALAENTSVEFLVVRVTSDNYISKLNPELFGAAVSNVVEVKLLMAVWKYIYASQQLEALFSAILAGGKSLKKLKLTVTVSKPSINPELMGKALNMLEEVTTCCWHSSEQIAAIIKNLVDGESKLKKLLLFDADPEVLGVLDQVLISRAKEKVGEFFSADREQWKAIFDV